MATYNFTVHTGDIYLGGTDSNIFLQLQGDLGKSFMFRTNGHIKGNAYERDQIDKFSINLEGDYGDIHTIYLKSDCMYAGSGWFLDYIKIKKEGSNIESIFNINQWIEDTNERTFTATSGYPKDISAPKLKVVNLSGGRYTISPNTKVQINVCSEIRHEVDYSKVEVLDSTTKASVSVPVDVVKLAFEQQINASISETIKQISSECNRFEAIYEIEPSSKERALEELWIEENYSYSVVLGSKIFNFDLPKTRRFAGFKDVSTGNNVDANKIK